MRSHPSLQPLPLTHLLLRIDKKPWKQLLPRLSLYSVVSITELLLLLQLIELSSSLSSPYQIDKVFHFLIGCIHTRLCI